MKVILLLCLTNGSLLFRNGDGNIRAFAGKYEFTSDDVEQLALSAVQALK
jgi:hypothetical protein